MRMTCCGVIQPDRPRTRIEGRPALATAPWERIDGVERQTACGNVEIHRTDSHISTRIINQILTWRGRFIEGRRERKSMGHGLHGIRGLQEDTKIDFCGLRELGASSCATGPR